MTFAGVRPVLHTPFGASRGAAPALDELERLAERMAAEGAAGLVALGLASEAWALGERERDAIVERVVAAAAGLPVTVGIDGATALAVDRARRAARLGAASLMVLPPAPTGLGDHLHALAAIGLPILLQDAPQVTGVVLDAEALAELAAAVKVEGPASGPKITALVAAGVEVVAGWGGLHFPEALRRGATGLMPGCDLAAAFAALHAAWLAGREDEADERYEALLPYLAYQAQSLELLVLAAKRELLRRGVFAYAALRDHDAALDAVQAASLDRCVARLADRRVPGFEP